MRVGAGRRLGLLAAVLACAAAACALAAPGSGARAAQASAASRLIGVNISPLGYGSNPAEAAREVAAAAALHARVVRIELPWAVFEPHGAGQIDPHAQAFADRLAAAAAAAGIRLIVTAESTPCWASSAPQSLLRGCRTNRITRANAWPPTHPSDYAAFTAYIASRYASVLAAIDVWNEPDQSNEAYFAGPHKPQRYAAVLRAAYPAIKQAAPGVAVLAGSLVGSNGQFLRALYAAGIRGFYDGLAVHFYNLTLASLRYIHEVQLAAGDRTPLWLNEFGWTSCWPRQRIQQEQACVTSPVQAANLADLLRSLGRAPYVASAVVYKLQDSSREDFGLLTQAGAHKQAFRTLARTLPFASGAVSPVRLALRRRGSHVIASGSAPVGDFMFLEAFQGTLLRYRVLFTLDRFNRYSITLPAVLGTSGLRVRVYQDWTGLARAAQRSI